MEGDKPEKQKTIDNYPITITETLKKQSFTISPYHRPYIQDVVVPEGLIKSRIERLTTDIANYYENKPFTIIVIMKQGYKVFNLISDYLEKIYEKGVHNNTVRVEFVRLSSFVGVQEANDIEVVGLDLIDVKGKDLLVVEAIVETGLSLSTLLKQLMDKGAKSTKVFSLVIKENRTQFDFPIDFLGFVIPAKFVVGFGLDYNDNFRDLNHICSLNDNGIDSFKKKKSHFSRSRQYLD
eukprot:CAMPEP_0176464018 /NCGR_PEP_ID=MMETSP0127-20121128/36256_1 /TAXON_ID=938130 /ORGANISM="Platyophrya macrostoma, Strain WH" /LENGTH=236 /DNA_ID=CAMNT_0017856333 /DNA_START=44 /DNA_END=754 /DNA_ORIENTATION=+